MAWFQISERAVQPGGSAVVALAVLLNPISREESNRIRQPICACVRQGPTLSLMWIGRPRKVQSETDERSAKNIVQQSAFWSE